MASRPELKVDDEIGFIKFFRNLNQKGSDTIRIFFRGEFYTAHGDDAVFIARTVCMSTPLSDYIPNFVERCIELPLSFVS